MLDQIKQLNYDSISIFGMEHACREDCVYLVKDDKYWESFFTTSFV